jgi:hypothetical protein
VQKLLLPNKELFGEKKGLTSLISHTIENSSVIFSKPRKLSMAEHDQANKLTATMLKDRVINLTFIKPLQLAYPHGDKKGWFHPVLGGL